MGKSLLLKSGSNVDPDELTAAKDDVIKGKTAFVHGYDDPVAGTLELTGNASAGDVISGKTFYTTNPKLKLTGTIPNRGSNVHATSSGSNTNGIYYYIPRGYYYEGTDSGWVYRTHAEVASTIGLTSAKLAKGQSVCNVAGTYTSDANATAPYISSGKTAYVNGSKITGTLATQGGSTTTPGTANKTIVTASKHVTGNIIVAGSSNLTAANIKKGVNIFGVTGTWSGYVPTNTDLYIRGNNVIGFESPFSSIVFDSGQITRLGPISASMTIRTTSKVNLTGFSRLSIETTVQTLSTSGTAHVSHGYIKLNLINDDNSQSSVASYTFPTTGNFTATIGLSAVQKTARLLLDTSGWTGAIFRIWLS